MREVVQRDIARNTAESRRARDDVGTHHPEAAAMIHPARVRRDALNNCEFAYANAPNFSVAA